MKKTEDPQTPTDSREGRWSEYTKVSNVLVDKVSVGLPVRSEEWIRGTGTKIYWCPVKVRLRRDGLFKVIRSGISSNGNYR